jgi:lambda family phage minor tail protein L
MNELLNVDLQEQSPSAEETASGNAIVTLFEIYLANSDLGGAGTDKLYFHDGTKSPADSYGSLQMYSPTAESSWGSTTASDYSLVTYTPFPFEFSGYERRTKGALPRPTIRFANINRDFTVYNTNHNDLLGAKVIRRKTLAKYLLENPPVEFPKEIYYVERLVSENQIMVEFELTTNFDVRGVVLPSRRIVAARCPWKYKDSTVGGCDWPTDSTKDITDINSITTSEKIYIDVDDNYITAGNVTSGSAATAYDVWGTGRSYTKDYFTEYYIPLAADYTISAAARVDATHVKYTTADTSLGFSADDYINIRGSAVSDWDFGEIHLKISAVAESGGNTEITAITTESSGFDAYTSGGLISKTRNTLFRCLRTHTSTAPRRPGVATADWEVGDVCGKRLTSCRMRYGYNPNAGSVEDVIGEQSIAGQQLGVGYSSAPDIAIAAPSSGTTATATCTVSGGAINAITVTEAGSGYSSPPVVTVSGGSPSTAAILIAVCRGGAGSPADVPLPYGGFPGAVTYS